MRKIKAINIREFKQACSNGEVYGKYRKLYVYIELGIEQDYREHPSDNPKTEYRLFRGCSIEYSETQSQSEEGIYQYSENDVDVILYW
jgi:hypothetical protein